MKTRSWIVYSAGILLVCISTLSAPVDAVPVVKVCALGCEYQSIQSAVDAVAPETVILVKPGVYEENLMIDGAESLTIANSGGGVVALTGDRWQGAALSIFNSVNVAVQGMHISGGEPGVLIQNTNTVTLQDVDIQDARGQGVRVVRSVARLNNVIVVNTGRDRDQENGQGIRLENAQVSIGNSSVLDNAHFGILAAGASAVLVEHTSVVGNHVVGVALADQAEATIQFSWIAEQKPDQIDGRFGRGVESTSSGVVMVLNNAIHNNAEAGLTAHTGSQVAAFDNTIENNGTFGALLTGNADVALVRNHIVGNDGPGIYLGQQAVSVISGNLVANNGGAGVGIGFSEIGGESVNVQLRNNVFRSNAACDVFVDTDGGIVVNGSGNTLSRPLADSCDQTGKLNSGFVKIRG